MRVAPRAAPASLPEAWYREVPQYCFTAPGWLPGDILSSQFTRNQRLLAPADYKRVFSKPLKSSDAVFTVLARSRPNGQGPARLGLAIAKKQLRRAVDRNRVKRLVREYFRLSVPHKCAMDFVVMTRSIASQRSNSELNASLAGHFSRLIRRA